MKKIVFLLLLAFCCKNSFSQFTWTWLDGTALTPGAANFGIKGVPDSANDPGNRIGQKTWIDKDGDTWVFGGLGYNDIWKFSEVSGNWTWINGTKFPVDAPVYGVQKVFSPANRIGTRNYAATWTDTAGDLWVFGGQRDPACASSAVLVVATNELWKYSVSNNQWAWMGGDTPNRFNPVVNFLGRYGTKGLTSPLNKPSSKHHAMNWKDKDGNLWLFGGGYGGSINNSDLNSTYLLTNDLWKYDPAAGMWTWISGDSVNASSSTPYSFSAYGTKGLESAANTPGQRYAGTTWTDSSGNFWLFGGYGVGRNAVSPPNSVSYGGLLSDLWRFSPVSGKWTWMGGDTLANVTGRYISSEPQPGPRAEGTAWTDSKGNLWLRSGSANNNRSVYNTANLFFNDIWKYSIAENRWTWIGGDSTVQDYKPAPVEHQVFLPSINPGPDPGVVKQQPAGRLLFSVAGGQRWLYDTASRQWSFVKGQISPANATTPVIDTVGKPATRYFSTTWKDASNNLYMFGGQRSVNSYSDLYDLWKYNVQAKTWTFLKGGKGFAGSIVGVIGQPSDSDRPSPRSGAYAFTDQAGRLWMFGGTNGVDQSLTDLWSFDPATNQWTCYNDGSFYNTPVYAATPTQPVWPGPRGFGNSWTDASNNFWIFGGQVGTYGNATNEIWMFNPQTRIWTFIGGDKVTGNPPFNSTPSGRTGATSWTDRDGNFWLFGGGSYNNRSNDFGETRFRYNNDLHKYSPVTKIWTRMNGSSIPNSRGNYGVKGSPSADNMPRARMNGSGWTDAAGNLYLFGGSKDTVRPCVNTSTELLNDLWKYTIATGQWTWIGGEDAGDAPGRYGVLGTASRQNEPGARLSVATWSNASGKAWIYGGYGYAQSGKRALDDVMMFTASEESALPVTYTRFTATEKRCDA